MKQYRITCEVAKVVGWQTFTVKAKNVKEARRKFLTAHNDVEYEMEEVDIMSLGEPEIEEIKE